MNLKRICWASRNGLERSIREDGGREETMFWLREGNNDGVSGDCEGTTREDGGAGCLPGGGADMNEPLVSIIDNKDRFAGPE